MPDTDLSKLLSFVLRHRPAALGLTLDVFGWVELDVLVEALTKHGHLVTRERVLEVVRTSDKQRFVLDPSGRPRSREYGHSHPVEPGYASEAPPVGLGSTHSGGDSVCAPKRPRRGPEAAQVSQHVDAIIDEVSQSEFGGVEPLVLALAAEAHAVRSYAC